MPLPERANSIILLDGRELKEATPLRLTRRRNNAAIFEFQIPRKTFLSLRDSDKEARQGSIVQCFYGLGTGQQRVFYGYLPSTVSDRNLSENDTNIRLTSQDFIGQLADRVITLGDSTGSFLNPMGHEIGGFVATLARTVIDSQIGVATEFSIQGVQGTNPSQFITESNAILGSATAKAFVDSYSKLAFDNSPYPDAPLLYEYMQRDQYLVWRKELSLVSAPSSLRLTVGSDAIVSGTISTRPLYTDAYATGKAPDAAWTHSDRDSARRWGGRRFWASLTTQSSFQSDAYDVAVRQVELYKNERRTFSLVTGRDPFILYPGDVISLDNGAASGLPDGKHRVSEVVIGMSPTLRTTITVGDEPKLLTNYL